jgi:LPS-assembly protein
VTGQAIHSYTSADPLAGFLVAQQELQLNVGLKLTDYWSLIGSVRYDIDAKRMIQDSLGLKYQDECFVLTATYADTRITNAEQGIKPDQSFMLRFEFKHLGEFNYRTDVSGFLSRGDNQPSSP